MKKIVLMFCCLVASIVFHPSKVSAAINSLVMDDMGTYTQTELVMERLTIYIPGDLVSFFASTGKAITTQETKHYFLGIYIYSTFKYFFIEDKYVERIIESRQLYNDIDTLIFMVSELEKEAQESGVCGTNDSGGIQNCVLSYIRSINISYYDNSAYGLGSWEVIAGGVNENFIDYISENDTTFYQFRKYFAQFLSPGVYNSQLHGTVPSLYTTRNYYLIDPLNTSSYIDLIHMIASIDGIINYTGSSIINSVILQNNSQKDIVSWAGDLQTFARELHEKNIDASTLPSVVFSGTSTNTNVDFCEYIGESSCTFSEEDLLADVDAFNIAKGFLDDKLNPVSSALSAYYNRIESDNDYHPNRYKMFLLTATEELSEYVFGTNIEEKFLNEVYHYLDLKKVNGVYSNKWDLIGLANQTYYLLLDSYNPWSSDMPSTNIRVFAAELFYNYVIYMSSRPV
jgi:hypothetical protein